MFTQLRPTIPIYWAVGLEDAIPAASNVDVVGTFTPTPFKAGGHAKGVKPADLR